MTPLEFNYRVSWRSDGLHPGAHAGRQVGGSQDFYGHAPLLASPDPRHLDIHATLHEPFGQFLVRTYRQRSSISVFIVADLSASMAVGDKHRTLAHLAASIAYSAYRTGDACGLIACAETLQTALCLPARWNRGSAERIQRALLAQRPRGRTWQTSLHQAADYLGQRKALVFLLSDFHLPLTELDAVWPLLATHDVVPLVIWENHQECADWPAWRWTRWVDPESGLERLIWLRPRVLERLRATLQERRAALQQFFEQRGRAPFFLADGWDADALTRYFY